MTDITVTVSGPGECLAPTIEVIKRALANANSTVTVTDEYPKIVLDHDLNLKRDKITIVAKHCAWGG